MAGTRNKLLPPLGALICLALATPAMPGTAPFGATAAIADSDLDEMRGGIELPNGMDLTIGIDIETRVNGALVLQTVYSSDRPTLTVTQAFDDNISTAGTVTQKTTSQGTRVSLTSPSLTIQHLVGQTTGSIVANTANNQTIETITNININLKGVSPIVTNNLFTVNEIAAQAAVRPQL